MAFLLDPARGYLDEPQAFDIYGRRILPGAPRLAPGAAPEPMVMPAPEGPPQPPPRAMPDMGPTVLDIPGQVGGFVGNVASGLWDMVKYPGQYMRGEATRPPTEWAADTALSMVGTGTAFPAKGVELRAGGKAPKGKPKPPSEPVNPQVDKGFNYGQPVDLPLPKDYPNWIRSADAIRREGGTGPADPRSWPIDMALRDIRVATTPEQRRAAVAYARDLKIPPAPLVPLGAYPTTRPRKVANVTNEKGGYTVKLDTGDVPQTGFMVGMHPNTDARTTVGAGAMMPSTVQRHVAANIKELNKPDVHLGTWMSGGRSFVDNAMRFDPALNNAQRRAAIYGYPTRQEAMFDLGAPPGKGELPITPWQDYIMKPEFSGPGGKLDQLYQRGYGLLEGKPWWENEIFKQTYGARFPQFASFLAATSPNNGIRMNLMRATEYMRRAINEQPAIQPGFRVPEGSLLRPGTKMPMEGSSGLDPNLRRVERGGLVSGPKVSDIEQAMLGNPAATPIDRWMARASEEPKTNSYAAATPGDITDQNYAFMRNEMFPRAAKELSGENPMEFSAKVWTGIMDTAGKTGELFGVPYPGLPGVWTPYAKEWVNLLVEKSAKLGINPDQLWKDIQKGSGTLLTAVLAIPGGAELIRQMQAGPPQPPPQQARP